MSTLANATASGHSRKQEKKVAKKLYIAIIAAVIVGMIAFFLLGQSSRLNPVENNPSSTSKPATPSVDPANN